uniref:Uncharacterized protein n=1 Tax=Arion vulgaris TaxID=1028688 RepID=A0A0B6ZE03_9EUPU
MHYVQLSVHEPCQNVSIADVDHRRKRSLQNLVGTKESVHRKMTLSLFANSH